jgi:uncharacterized protein
VGSARVGDPHRVLGIVDRIPDAPTIADLVLPLLQLTSLMVRDTGQVVPEPMASGLHLGPFIRQGQTAATAKAVAAVAGDPRHEFWPDGVSYTDVSLTGVIGHRQATEAYLVQLARVHDGRLASFDRGLSKLHSDVVELVPHSVTSRMGPANERSRPVRTRAPAIRLRRRPGPWRQRRRRSLALSLVCTLSMRIMRRSARLPWAGKTSI